MAGCVSLYRLVRRLFVPCALEDFHKSGLHSKHRRQLGQFIAFLLPFARGKRFDSFFAARNVGCRGDAGVGSQCGRESLKNSVVAVWRFNKKLCFSRGAAFLFKRKNGLTALIFMHGQVAQKTKALPVHAAGHQREQN